MSEISRLLAIMAQLRDPLRGCPWDREQTFKTIVPHTLEEAYEVAETIEQDDLRALQDELGDLLFQIVFYAQLAQEQQLFNFGDIVKSICDKLERRHPHVFSDAVITSADEQTVHWEKLKAEERANKPSPAIASVLDGITATLPALALAQKIQKRVATVGFDWPDHHGVVAKVQEELAEVQNDWEKPERCAEEIGDLLFACVNLARHADVDAESALRQANRKFTKRFHHVEDQLRQQGVALKSASLAQLDTAWNRAKQIKE